MNTEHFTRISGITLNTDLPLNYAMPYAVLQLQSRFAVSSTLAIHYTQYTALPWGEDCPVLAICQFYKVLIAFLEPSMLFQAALDIPRMFCPFLVGVGSGSLGFRGLTGRTLLGAVALGCNIIAMILSTLHVETLKFFYVQVKIWLCWNAMWQVCLPSDAPEDISATVISEVSYALIIEAAFSSEMMDL